MAKVPLKKAIGIILGVTLLISGSASLLLIYVKHIQHERMLDPKYDILAIVQASTEKEPLKTVYLAELLNFSVDKVTNIYNFNTKVAERKLLSSPLIKKAEVKKIYPGTVYIHYVSAVPIAFLLDYENTAIDKEGVLIPFKPFFTPKILPEIYLGLEENKIQENETQLGMRCKDKRMQLALKLLDFVNTHLASDMSVLKRIDVSHAYTPSFGQKQIVMMMEDKIEKIKNGRLVLDHHLRILRLSSNGYEQELTNYQTLRNYLSQKEKMRELKPSNEIKVIDLRIPRLAFVSEG